MNEIYFIKYSRISNKEKLDNIVISRKISRKGDTCLNLMIPLGL
jgi:hypothetical protein